MAIKKTKIIFIGLILLLTLTWAAIWQLPDNRLHLVFCNVGQGDAILVIHGSNQVLIDGGPTGGEVLACLSDNLPFWDRQLEMVVLTHPDADHLTGLIDVIERYSVSQFVVNSLAKDTAGFWQFREAVLAEGTPVFSPQAGETIKFGDARFQVLWPQQRYGESLVWQPEISQEKVLGAAVGPQKEINDTSIVLKLTFGHFDVLLPGDISTKIETQLSLEKIEVLKVAHHGSKFSTDEAFLAKVKPELAVISVGHNRFGHPTQEVLDRLTAVGAKILRTDQAGEIEIVSDGKSWYTKPR